MLHHYGAISIQCFCWCQLKCQLHLVQVEQLQSTYALFWYVFCRKEILYVCKVKFINSEKAIKFCEIFPLHLTVCTEVKSKVKISQILWLSQNIWTHKNTKMKAHGNWFVSDLSLIFYSLLIEFFRFSFQKCKKKHFALLPMCLSVHQGGKLNYGQ